MNKRTLWSRILCIVGLAMTATGAVASVFSFFVHFPGYFSFQLDALFLPSLLILPASGLVALSAFLERSRYRIVVYSAFGLAVIVVSGWIAHYVLLTTRHFSVPSILEGPLRLISNLSPWASFIGAVLVVFEPLSASKTAALGDVSIDTRRRSRSGTLSLVGLAMIAIGLLTIVVPTLESGGLLFLGLPAGSGLVTVGAFLGKSRYRVLWLLAFVMTALWSLVLIMFSGDM